VSTDRKRKSDEPFDAAYHQLDSERRKRRALAVQDQEAKRQQLWIDHAYTSANLALSSDKHEGDGGDLDIQHVTGDITNPIRHTGHIQVIVHCVNTSGEWTTRGVFGALNRLDPSIADRYALAKQMKDLNLGDAHLLATSTPDVVVCLLVAISTRTHELLTQHYEKALERLSGYVLEHDAGVHVPKWPTADGYRIERILKRRLLDRGVPIWVYYHPRHRSVPVLNDFLDGCRVLLMYGASVGECKMKREMERRVWAFGGQVVDCDDEDATHGIVSPWFSSAENVDGVGPDLPRVFRCNVDG
jgi:hypothetical protein